MHIARGDDIDARDNHGFTPLMLAAARDRANICSMLLEAGAQLNAMHPAGRDARGIAKDARAATALAVLDAAWIASSTSPDEQTVEAAGRRTARGESEANVDPINIASAFDDEVEIDESGWEPENFAEPLPGDPTLLSGISAVQRSIAHRSARPYEQARGTSIPVATRTGDVIALIGRPLPENPPSPTDPVLPPLHRASARRNEQPRSSSSSPLPRAEDAKAFAAAAALVVRLANPGRAG